MEAKAPIQYIEVRCCGKTAPCPKCGKRGRRKQLLPARLVRTIAYKQVVYLRIGATAAGGGEAGPPRRSAPTPNAGRSPSRIRRSLCSSIAT